MIFRIVKKVAKRAIKQVLAFTAGGALLGVFAGGALFYGLSSIFGDGSIPLAIFGAVIGVPVGGIIGFWLGYAYATAELAASGLDATIEEVRASNP